MKRATAYAFAIGLVAALTAIPAYAAKPTDNDGDGYTRGEEFLAGTSDLEADSIPDLSSYTTILDIENPVFDGAVFFDNIDRIGSANLTFETGYPGIDSSWPHTFEVVEKMVVGLDDETTYQILRGNGLRMLGLD